MRKENSQEKRAVNLLCRSLDDIESANFWGFCLCAQISFPSIKRLLKDIIIIDRVESLWRFVDFIYEVCPFAVFLLRLLVGLSGFLKTGPVGGNKRP